MQASGTRSVIATINKYNNSKTEIIIKKKSSNQWNKYSLSKNNNFYLVLTQNYRLFDIQ